MHFFNLFAIVRGRAYDKPSNNHYDNRQWKGKWKIQNNTFSSTDGHLAVISELHEEKKTN